MTAEEKNNVIKRLQEDIYYFRNMDFQVLARKFSEDLAVIEDLQHELDTIKQAAKQTVNKQVEETT